MKRPVKQNSAARAGPMSRGSSHDVPRSPADSPIRTNAALKRAPGEPIRMSAASASASPPPVAAPLTAAMTGIGSERIAVSARAARSCCVEHPERRQVGQAVGVGEVEAGAERACRRRS